MNIPTHRAIQSMVHLSHSQASSYSMDEMRAVGTQYVDRSTIKNPFRNHTLALAFETCLIAVPIFEDTKGNPVQWRGAIHRCAFWNGATGITVAGRSPYDPQSQAHAFWRAGKAYNTAGGFIPAGDTQ